jgi:hypothetical protein
MLDYTTVTREIRSLISRRRELLTFLGTVFAALSVFLQNALEGGLPPALRSFYDHLFAVYALLLMVPCLILALRLARLSNGMTLNGILYQRLMMEQDFTKKATAESMQRAGRINFFGVSFLMFVLAVVIAAFSAVLFGLALAGDVELRQGYAWVASAAPWLSFAIGVLIVASWIALYVWYNHRVQQFAFHKAAAEPIQPFGREEWEAHSAGSLEDANHDMITVLALVGLIVFAAFEGLSALNKVSQPGKTFVVKDADVIIFYGPLVYSLLTTVTCFFGMATYIRLRIAVGQRSLELDPTDHPFKPLRLTDSFLGYLLLDFLLVVSLHCLAASIINLAGQDAGQYWVPLVALDVLAFILVAAAEQVTVVIFGRRHAQR